MSLVSKKGEIGRVRGADPGGQTTGVWEGEGSGRQGFRGKAGAADSRASPEQLKLAGCQLMGCTFTQCLRGLAQGQWCPWSPQSLCEAQNKGWSQHTSLVPGPTVCRAHGPGAEGRRQCGTHMLRPGLDSLLRLVTGARRAWRCLPRRKVRDEPNWRDTPEHSPQGGDGEARF